MQIHEIFRNKINFRDLGGLQTNDGKFVRKGYFYRGAGLNFFNEEELEYFKTLNIKTIMDLRSSHEINKYPDPTIENINAINHNGLNVEGFEDIDWSPAGMRKIGGEAYEQLNKIENYYKHIAFNNTAFKLMVKEIENDNLPLYFHCAVGKDRTGVAAMIIGLILNVEKEEIRKDYLLSNYYRKDILNSSLDKIKDETKDHPELITLVTRQEGVVPETFDTVMDSILDKYGTYDNYLEKEYNLDLLKLNKIRDKYTEKTVGLY